MNSFSSLTRQRENWMPAKRSQATSQLRLKNHHQRDGEEDREAPDNPSNYHQIQQRGDQGQRKKHNRQSRQHFRPPRPPEVEVAVVNSHPQQKDFHQAAPASEPEINELVNHFVLCRIASLTRNAYTFSFTSGTRNTSAPRARRSEVSATPGASRLLISGDPINLPRNDLRETPTTRARSCARSRSICASNSRLCSTVFPKPIPGSNAIAMGSMFKPMARPYCCRKNSEISATTPVFLASF